MAAQNPSEKLPPRLQEIIDVADRVEDLGDAEEEYEDIQAEEETMAELLTRLKLPFSPLKDTLQTESSELTDETLAAILPYLEGNPNGHELNSFNFPKLQRAGHVSFLKQSIQQKYPAPFAAIDASRPWFYYWALQGLTALGQDVSNFREQLVYTFRAAQHPEGGHGGGHGQLPHLATTYAGLLSLAIVGGEEAYDSVDRRAAWHYLGRMKQADGGFTMTPNGEEDIRGAFCALVVLSLLNLPTDLPPDAPAREQGMTSFLDRLGEWISRCQSYEGGISAAPGNEAHGAYAFCALGALSILGSPKEMINKYYDVPSLIHWLASRQVAPEGGNNGRTNKLVDGCYSHWVGSCWALVEAAAGKGIWNRTDLARYILSAAQGKKGGLRDKPGKRPDGYHTCYNLAGLSAAQHIYTYDESATVGDGPNTLEAPFRWKAEGIYEGPDQMIWDEGDVVEFVHPVFVIPWGAAEKMRKYFEAKEGF